MSWTESQGREMFGGYNLTFLELDQAWLNVTNLSSRQLALYQLSADCQECPYVKHQDISVLGVGGSAELVVNTKFPISYRLESAWNEEVVLENDTRSLHCKVETNMGEFGVYEMTVDDTGCAIKTALQPVSIFLPFLIPIIFYLVAGIIFFLVRKYKEEIVNTLRLSRFSFLNTKPAVEPSKTMEGSTSSSNLNNLASSQPRRLRSLDTFRGICIVIMMFVHDGAGGYYFLDHATWDGLYVADLVFPWFLWIMGVCVPVSIKSQIKRNASRLTIVKRIVIRSLKLIAIGILLNSNGGPVELSKLRFPGVLQRFGLCYLVVALSLLLCANEDFCANRKAESKYIAMIQDVVFIWKGWVVALSAVILHTCLTFLLKVPGCPTGYLGPGGLHKGSAYPGECIGGASGYIDKQILKLEHIYQWPTAMNTYKSTPYDPEGILGTLTAIFTVWLGVQAGLTLHVYSSHRSRILRWTVWAVVTGAIAAALSGAKVTGGLIPLNKNLWSLSFVFALSSFALVLLIFLYVVIDVWKVWSGSPFFEPGMNSILLYIAHLVGNELLPWHFRFKRMNTHLKRLVESLWGITLWVLYSIYLYNKKFFWTL